MTVAKGCWGCHRDKTEKNKERAKGLIKGRKEGWKVGKGRGQFFQMNWVRCV